LLHSPIGDRIVWVVLAGQLVMADVFVQVREKKMSVYKRSFYIFYIFGISTHINIGFIYKCNIYTYIYIYKGL